MSFPVENDSVMTYLMSYYWTILAMTTIGDLPQPKTKSEYLFVIFELTIGLIMFATVLGYIANIVTNISAARKDFQGKSIIPSQASFYLWQTGTGHSIWDIMILGNDNLQSCGVDTSGRVTAQPSVSQ